MYVCNMYIFFVPSTLYIPSFWLTKIYFLSIFSPSHKLIFGRFLKLYIFRPRLPPLYKLHKRDWSARFRGNSAHPAKIYKIIANIWGTSQCLDIVKILGAECIIYVVTVHNNRCINFIYAMYIHDLWILRNYTQQ